MLPLKNHHLMAFKKHLKKGIAKLQYLFLMLFYLVLVSIDDTTLCTVLLHFTIKTLSRQSLLTHDRKRSLAYNEDEQYKSVVSNRAFPSLLKKLDEQES